MTIGNPVAILRQKFAQSIGLPFADVLSESDIESALEDEGVTYRKRLFCPIVTLWAWISQVLDKDKSCKKAVSRVISYLVAEGMTPPSTDTGAYCKARARLKERMLLGVVFLPDALCVALGHSVALKSGSQICSATWCRKP